MSEWVIWSFEHQAWWGPGRVGYVIDLASAGRYSEGEALQIEQRANQFLKPGEVHERALLLAEAEALFRARPGGGMDL